MRRLTLGSRNEQIVPGLDWYRKNFHKKLLELEEKLKASEEERTGAIERLKAELHREFELKIAAELTKAESRIWEQARTHLLNPEKMFLASGERLLSWDEAAIAENTQMMWEPTTRYAKMASLSGLPGLAWSPKADLLKKLVGQSKGVRSSFEVGKNSSAGLLAPPGCTSHIQTCGSSSARRVP